MIPWILFNLFILICLLVDLFCHRKNVAISIKDALISSILWIGVALLFNLFLWIYRGGEDALIFFTGYLLEKSLSVDNLAVFVLIFTVFNTPAMLRHRVLFWGVFGAIVMRGLFIYLGITLIEWAHPIFYIFGIFLIWMGIKFFFNKKRIYDPSKNWTIKVLKFFFPISNQYEGDKFFTRIQGVLMATPLFVVLLSIETADLIFALDSIPVILGITLDPFLVYTSNIFAILGLRSLYFLLEGMVERFTYLHFGIGLLLIFIGLKMLSSDLITIPIWLTLGIILAIILIAIFLSLSREKKR